MPDTSVETATAKSRIKGWETFWHNIFQRLPRD
jgi:hypothetical protein